MSATPFPTPQSAARALGGEVYGDRISCPGPGHSPKDRSLSVKFDPNAPDGFLAHSFAGDDALACRDHIRERLGLPPWRPGSPHKRTSSSRFARQEAPSDEPAKSASDSPFPEWTPPDPGTGKPRFVGIGSEEPPVFPDEMPGRRHVYRRAGQNVRAKVKKQDGKYVDCYRVYRPDTGEVGWQAKRPEGYRTVPYISSVDPFDRDHADTPVFVTEGEKDADSVARLGLPAMTFGSSSDKPEGCEMFVSGRDVVILADNDKPGLKHAAAIFARSAKSVKVVSFEEKDVSDWIEAGGTVDELWRRVDAAQCVEIKEPTTPDTPLPIFSAAELAGKPVPERRFHVPEWIPARNVTLIYGDGGTGKSLIALQLAVATVLGSTWLGLPVAGGPALYLTAEDEKDEVHRRLVDIAQHLGTSLNDLGNLHIVSLAGLDAVLATPDRKSSLLAPTALLGKIEKAIADIRPAFVILDTLADIYGGEENIRTQVRQFVGMLRGLALQHDTTIAVPAHPSLSGLSSGSGSSGSTGWNNSVRSRLYLERVKDESGAEPDPNARVLRKMKANYSTIGDEIRVRWERGVFVPTSAAATGFSALAAKQDADEIFATLVGAYQTEKRHVSSTPSANFAPAVFARDARSQGIGKKALGDAMNRLFAARRIKVLEVGPPSRRLKSIVLANAETALDP